MQELLSIIYPCSRTLYKHWAFCPCLSGRTWECFWASLPRYSCQLHPVLSREKTQLQTSPLHPMQWKPQLMVQDLTARAPAVPVIWTESMCLEVTYPILCRQHLWLKQTMGRHSSTPHSSFLQKKMICSLFIHFSYRVAFFFPLRIWAVFLIDQDCKIRQFFAGISVLIIYRYSSKYIYILFTHYWHQKRL